VDFGSRYAIISERLRAVFEKEKVVGYRLIKLPYAVDANAA
jgi:hypothetical protein